MRVIIDRFEEDFAVVEIDQNGTMLSVPRALFPEAHEGDTVEINVLGKVLPEDTQPPHEIFERLRRRSRRHRQRSSSTARKAAESNAQDADKIEEKDA